MNRIFINTSNVDFSRLEYFKVVSPLVPSYGMNGFYINNDDRLTINFYPSQVISFTDEDNIIKTPEISIVGSNGEKIPFILAEPTNEKKNYEVSISPDKFKVLSLDKDTINISLKIKYNRCDNPSLHEDNNTGCINQSEHNDKYIAFSPMLDDGRLKTCFDLAKESISLAESMISNSRISYGYELKIMNTINDFYSRLNEIINDSSSKTQRIDEISDITEKINETTSIISSGISKLDMSNKQRAEATSRSIISTLMALNGLSTATINTLTELSND